MSNQQGLCPNCGQTQNYQNDICEFCGNRLPWSRQPKAVIMPPPPPGMPPLNNQPIGKRDAENLAGKVIIAVILLIIAGFALINLPQMVHDASRMSP